MAQSLANVLVHLVFSTKERRPFIHERLEKTLYSYIITICHTLNSPVHQIGGMADHLHVLISLSRMNSLSKIVGDIKANSSRWIKTQGDDYREFAWQSGYGAFSIGQSGFEATVKYIAQQKEHHKKFDFKDEFLALLNKYKTTYNETYLWD